MTKPKSTKRSTRPFSSLPDAAYEGIEKSLTSTDGRKIAWHEYGPEDGFPVFYCHGTPGSAIEAAVFAPAARRHGCRIIAINRPGLGDSDFKPDRTVADWATDLEQVADSLGYQEFSVYGWSGGGPHALLSGTQLRERTRAIGLISPQGRYDPTKGASDKFLSRIWMPALKVLSDRPSWDAKSWALHSSCRITTGADAQIRPCMTTFSVALCSIHKSRIPAVRSTTTTHFLTTGACP